MIPQIFYYQMQGMNDRLIINWPYRPPKDQVNKFYYVLGYMSAVEAKTLDVFNYVKSVWKDYFERC